MTGFLSAVSFLPVHKLQQREEEAEVRGHGRVVTSSQLSGAEPELSSDDIITERSESPSEVSDGFSTYHSSEHRGVDGWMKRWRVVCGDGCLDNE